MQNWRGRLILGFVLALVVVLGLAFYGDLPRLLEAFRRWQWAYLPLVLVAVLANYGLRFLRWHYYLASSACRAWAGETAWASSSPASP